MRGKLQCTCSACGLEKGNRDRNNGWFNLVARGSFTGQGRHFCPSCSIKLLMAVDEALERPEPDPRFRLFNVEQLQDVALLTHGVGLPTARQLALAEMFKEFIPPFELYRAQEALISVRFK